MKPCECSGHSLHRERVAGPLCCFQELGSFLFFLERVFYWFEGSGFRGNLWKQQVLPGVTFWCVYLVHIVSKDAACGPELGCVGRWQKGITLRMCLMLKTGNAVV